MPRLSKEVIAKREAIAVDLLIQGKSIDEVQIAMQNESHGMMNLPRLNELVKLHSPKTPVTPVINITPKKPSLPYVEPSNVPRQSPITPEQTCVLPQFRAYQFKVSQPIPDSEIIFQGTITGIIRFLETKGGFSLTDETD